MPINKLDELEQEKLDQIQKVKNREDFLNAISQIESSGGSDIDHKEMSSGIHTGQSAIGKYGLMPNTINELARRTNDRDIASIPVDELAVRFASDQELQDKYAKSLADMVIGKQGDYEKAAYSWNMGHNLKPDVVDKMYKDSPYVEKFRRLFKKMK